MAEGATPAAPGTSVGQLTTQARADWARNRAALLALDPANAAVLDEVETALFCICLEDLVPDGVAGAADQLLHGDSANRWFDKAVSFIVFADGTAGINVEHCGLDGTTILSFVDTLLAQPAERTPPAPAPRPRASRRWPPCASPSTPPCRTRCARRPAFADFAAATATMTVSFTDFGAGTAKRLGVSPDAFVQMAYQLAHARTKGFVGATYESIATRQWRRGRTEAIRVVTPEVVAFVAAMADPGLRGPNADPAPSGGPRRRLPGRGRCPCGPGQGCQAGDAPEQHLWELQLIQQRRGEELGVTEPFALYSSPGWQIMRDDFLSTSSAPSQAIEVFGFGSTSSHCIGIGYVLNEDRLVLYLSTPGPSLTR